MLLKNVFRLTSCKMRKRYNFPISRENFRHKGASYDVFQRDKKKNLPDVLKQTPSYHEDKYPFLFFLFFIFQKCLFALFNGKLKIHLLKFWYVSYNKVPF